MAKSSSQYDEMYRRSIEDRENFWAEAAAGLDWHKPWDKVLDDSNPPFNRWFPGGEINVCYNAVDRHVAKGRGDATAIIFDSPGHTPQSACCLVSLSSVAIKYNT
jgi:propionyl-CoA synthetase